MADAGTKRSGWSAFLVGVYPGLALLLLGVSVDLLAFSPLFGPWLESHPHLHEFWTHVAIAIVVAGIVGLFIEFSHIRGYIEEQLRDVVLARDVLERLSDSSLGNMRQRVLEVELTRYLDYRGAELSGLIQRFLKEKLPLSYQKDLVLSYACQRVQGRDIIRVVQTKSFELVPPKNNPKVTFPVHFDDKRGFLSLEEIPSEELLACQIDAQLKSVSYTWCGGEELVLTPTRTVSTVQGRQMATYRWDYPEKQTLGSGRVQVRTEVYLRPWDLELYIFIIKSHTLGALLTVEHDGDYAQGSIMGFENATSDNAAEQSGLTRSLVVQYTGWLMQGDCVTWTCKYSHKQVAGRLQASSAPYPAPGNITTAAPTVSNAVLQHGGK